MLRRHRIILAYCKQMQWPDPSKLSMEQVMQVRKLESWIQSPQRLEEPVLSAQEILHKMAQKTGLYAKMAKMYVEDPEKSDLFVKEFFIQTLTNRKNCIEGMNEEIVKDVELYFQTRD